MSDICDRLRVALEGRYRIDRELGRGGMAIVYLAEDVKHTRLVALKVLRPELSAVLGSERFLREIQIAARLQHPHVLPLYDSGEADGLLYYVMPFVDGESLRDRLTRDGAVPWKEAVSIAIEVASALHYAHNQGIVHRDIKPGNILLSQGHAVVADFGIARAISSTDERELTKIEFAVGTPAYMSPEQALSAPDLDGRADVYSLGCVLFEMLTGNAPSDAQSSKSLLLRDSNPSVPRFESRIKQQIPRSVRGATVAALALDPEDRYQTADEMRDTLAQAVRGGGGQISVALQLIGTAAVILGLVYFLSIELGLPDFVFQALALVTVVQIGILMMATRTEHAGMRPRRLNRRRIRLIGSVSVAVLGVLSALHMAGRALGVGPGGGLVGAGALDTRERIILVDFENHTPDSVLGTVTTEAFRIDFAQSPIVTVVDPGYLRQVLAMMERPPSESITFELAREIAIREGIKAILAGEITTVGNGYMLSARIISAEDASVMAGERVSAASVDEVIEAIDRLSEKTRETIGESLRTIRQSEPLQRVTTPSLDALRKYSQAIRAIEAGDVIRGRSLLEEALELDSTFAMAHRRLGLVSLDRAEQVRALTRAYQYRDRLTERENGLAVGAYHLFVTGNDDEAIDALSAVLEQHPNDPTALNNMGLAHVRNRRYAVAERYFRRALDANPHSPARFAALVNVQATMGKLDEARHNLQQLRTEFPDHPIGILLAAELATSAFDYDVADSLVSGLLNSRPSRFWSAPANALLAANALVRGRLAVGESRFAEAISIYEAVPVPGAALLGEIQIALVDLLLRGRRDRAMERVDSALARYPLQDIDPLNRPYLQIAQLYAFAHDTERARAALDAFATDVEHRDLFRSVEVAMGGLIDLAASRPAEAVEKLKTADSKGCPICLLPFIGEAYDELGETDSTIAVLERYVSATWPARIVVDIVALIPVFERLARNYEERGEPSRALQYYRRIIDVWSTADEELQSTVEEARVAARRLSTRISGP